MIEPEKNLDEALKKSLQLRFKDLEAAVKPSLWKRIERETTKPGYAITSYILGTLLLLCLMLTCYERQNLVKTPVRSGVAASKVLAAKTKGNEENSETVLKTTDVVNTDNAPVRHMDAPLTGKKNYRHEKSSVDTPTGTRHAKTHLHPPVQGIGKKKEKEVASLKSTGELNPVNLQINALKTDTIFTERAYEMKLKPIPQLEAHLFKNTANEMVLPPVCQIKTGEVQSDRDLKAFQFLFSVIPLQTYQVLNISSTAANRFQNIEFAPILSLKSKGLKLSTGIQKKGIQLLVNYSFIRNWTYYEVGNGEVVVDRVADDQYILTEKGDSHIKNEKLHLLGLGIRKALPLRGPLHAYELKLGGDYARLLNEKQGIASVNLALTRPILFIRHHTLSIGPFAELGLNQRTVSEQTWKYRPYQFGISLDLKINNPYIKTLF